MIPESRLLEWNFEVELPTGLKVKGSLASSGITVIDTPIVNWKKDASAKQCLGKGSGCYTGALIIIRTVV